MDRERESIKRRMIERWLKEGKHIEEGMLELNDRNFDDAIRNHELTLIDFWAEWCAPCVLVEPILKEFAEKYRGRVTFGKLNVDGSPMISSRYKIMSIPTLMLFERGVPVDVLVGAMPKENIERWIRRHL